MKELSNKETKTIYCGGGITSTLINAVSKGINVFTDFGRYLGSSLRKIFTGNLCE